MRMHTLVSLTLFLNLTLFESAGHLLPVEAQSGSGGGTSGSGGSPGSSAGSEGLLPGSTGSSAGSSGMEDTEAAWKKIVTQSAKHSTTDSDYAESLIQLGMFYNRHDRYAEGRKALSKALSIIDGGALKPATGAIPSSKPLTIEHLGNGTVSATVNDVPPPYESTMQNLLPALISAELETGDLKDAETHVKKMILIAESGRISRVPALMSAYDQYSSVLAKMGRKKEAVIYKNKAEQIRSSIVGL